MVRILFTVCGIGMGHAGRSAMIMRHLKKKGHKLKVLSYGAGEKFLKTNFQVEKLEWFKLFFKKDHYKPDATILFNLPKLPKVFFKNLKTLTKIIEEFKPTVVISDFDVNGLYIAKLFNIPSITISNMHISNYLKIDLKLDEKIPYFLNHKSMLSAFNPTDYLFIIYPILPEKKFKKVKFFYPLVRKNFLKATPQEKNYFLVYSTPTQLEAIVPLLKKIENENFIVRGTEGKNTKNITFKPKVSIKQFSTELMNCKGVMCHGGLTIISEAITLNKPIYVFTDMQFFERYYNGKIVEKLGFGLLEEHPTIEGLTEFISGNKKYKSKISQIKIKPSNKKFLKALDELILKFSFRHTKNFVTRIEEIKEMLKEKNPKKFFTRLFKKEKKEN